MPHRKQQVDATLRARMDNLSSYEERHLNNGVGRPFLLGHRLVGSLNAGRQQRINSRHVRLSTCTQPTHTLAPLTAHTYV